ncbi:MAG: hypothetical protein NVS9B10_13480 [Nevskia sp.]
MILQLIDVIIGLVTVFLIFSTVASALVDLVEALYKMRGRLLERGIGVIFARVVSADGQLQKVEAPQRLVEAFYQSPAIYSLFQADYRPKGSNLPSYIPAERFAGAVLALAENGALARDFKAVRDTVLASSGADLAALDPVAWRAAAHAQLVAYFNDCMDRVSGWYARIVRWRLFALGLLLALCFNVDTLRLIRQLSEDDTLRQNLVSQALIDHGDDGGTVMTPATDADGVQKAQDQINRQLALVESLGLPVGWTRAEWQRVSDTTPDAAATEAPRWSPGRLLASGAFWSKLAGILLTGCALTFGAPFWFDLLNQLVKLRTSIKPDAAKGEDRPDAAADGKTAAVAAVRIETPKAG